MMMQTLNTTLMKHIPGDTNPWPSLQKVVLYEGSIAEMDPCLKSPDLATCIEVSTALSFSISSYFVNSIGNALFFEVNGVLSTLLRKLSDPVSPLIASHTCFKFVRMSVEIVFLLTDSETAAEMTVSHIFMLRYFHLLNFTHILHI